MDGSEFPLSMRVTVLKADIDSSDSMLKTLIWQAKQYLLDNIPEEILPRVKFVVLHYPDTFSKKTLYVDDRFSLYGVVALLDTMDETKLLFRINEEDL